MKTKNTITIKSVDHKCTDELDFVMRDDVLGKGWDEDEDDDGFVNEIYINQDLSRSVPVKIEDLRKILDKLEKKGCNYVSIDYHCDHIEYDLYGFEIRRATEQEIEDYISAKNKNKIDEINSRIAELDKEKEELLKRLNES